MDGKKGKMLRDISTILYKLFVSANSLALVFCSDTECSPCVSLRNMPLLEFTDKRFWEPCLI